MSITTETEIVLPSTHLCPSYFIELCNFVLMEIGHKFIILVILHPSITIQVLSGLG